MIEVKEYKNILGK